MCLKTVLYCLKGWLSNVGFTVCQKWPSWKYEERKAARYHIGGSILQETQNYQAAAATGVLHGLSLVIALAALYS